MWHYFNPLAWFGWFAQFSIAWVTSFRWSRLAAAVPAVIVLLLMTVGTGLAWSSANRWRENLVNRQILNATSQGDHETAELLLKRRLRTNPNDGTLQVLLGETYDATDRKEEARNLLREQALVHGNTKAAFWLLKTDYNEINTSELTPEQFDDLAKLAEVGLTEQPNNLGLHAVRAQYWMKNNNAGEAIQHLDKLKKVQLNIGLTIAALLKSQGDDRQAMREAEETVARVQEAIELEPKRADLRLLHAQALIFTEKYEDAIRTLSVGYEQSKDERLRSAIGEAIIVYSTKISEQKQDVNSLVTRLRLLQQAVRVAPTNPAVLKAIADTILSTVNEEDEQVVALREGILSGASPEIGHFVRGTAAMLKGDSELAAIELRLAAKGLPESSAILNNLAVAKTANAKSSGNEAAELQEAYELVDKALQLAKGSAPLASQIPYFHETRAQIHLLLKNYEDAISDFDEAMKAGPLQLQANLGLAQAYEALNQKDIADSHRQAAEKFRKLKDDEEEKSKDAVQQLGKQLRRDGAKPDADTPQEVPSAGTENKNDP